MRSMRQATFCCASTVLTLLLLLTATTLLLPCRSEAKTAEDTLIPIQVPAGTNLIHLTRDFCRDPSSWREIARINKLANPDLILHQTTLQIPLSFLFADQLSASVATVSGPVALLTGADQSEPLKKNDTLLPGQTLITGPDGYTHLILPDNTYTRIEPESRFTINYLIRLADGSIKADFTLNRGDLVHWMQKKLGPNDSFRTRTPIAITGIRGTEYRLKTTAAHANTVETLRGVVEVASSGRSITLASGNGSRIRQGRPPEPPRPLPQAPDGSAIASLYRSQPVMIHIPSHDQAQSFRLRITADQMGQETLVDKTTDRAGRFTITNLTDGAYFAFLTASDAEGFESRPTGPLPFTLRTNPSAPLVTAPKNNGMAWGKRTTIEWLASEMADHYSLQVATDAEFTHLIDQQSVTEARYTTPELQPGLYHCRVQTVTADGFSTLYSLPLAWKVVPEPAMGGMEATANNKPVLQWPVMAEGWAYDLQVARDKEFNTLLVDQHGLQATTFTLEEKLDAGTYYVRLRGVDKGEPVSPWTPAQSMTVKHKPLGWEELVVGLSILGILLL